MPARTFPNLGLKAGYDPHEDGWGDDMTLNMLKLSVLTQGTALDKVSAEPGSPTLGDVYILDETHATHPNEVIVYDGPTGGEAWVYIGPVEGWLIFNQAAGHYEKFDGTVWAEYPSGGGGSLPAGGTAGQVLTKQSSTDGDADWQTPGSGSGGAMSVDRVVTMTAVTEVQIKDLDFANYDYEFRFNARGTGRTGNCNLRIQTGGVGSSPTWNTTANTWFNQTGAVSGSVSSGQVLVGYSGTIAENEPIVSKTEMRTSDDLRTMNGFYYFGPYESRGVMAQNVTADIGSVRFLLSNGVWTGKIVVYKIAKA